MADDELAESSDYARFETHDRRRRPLSRRSLVWIVIAVILAVPAAMLPHLDALAGGMIPIAQSLLPAGALGLLVIAVVAAVSRAWIGATVLVAGAVLSVVPVLTPVRAAECTASTPLTVLSFNAKFAGADPGQLADLIRDAGADVVVLVETDEHLINQILDGEGLAETLPHRTKQVSTNAYKGSVVLSAHPLSAEEDIPGSVFEQVSAVATLPDGTAVRVAAVHPPPPVGQPEDWYEAVTAIDEWIQATSDPSLVVAGDFNSSFSHPVFRRLTADLATAAQAAGPIPWPTWPQEKPVPAFTAIDHVLARGAVPRGWASAYIEGSDHRAVIANWALCDSARGVSG
ncbi:endonuclease/exonuclease/phosphatase family protein [Microbacterium sp. UBA837]|uniref:endonuclease/exonuclease/phosphatase family protein n=1 Tax=Microbacterium sp. UBA837 TaxID=1946956 RepID=UPI0025D315D1|nr:endonuclease/exonuclease/phosphatase family protein [Microbacterium sp. UBA837]